MIDNLKYTGNTDRDGNIIQNYDGVDGTGALDGSAGTTGLVFRNGAGPNGPPSDPVGTGTTWNTISGSNTQSATNTNKAFWNNPMGTVACYSGLNGGNPIMDPNTLTHCGYFYNWFAATGGTGTYDANGMDTAGNQATSSICPTNFRLPSGISGTGGPTTNGTVYTHADFPVLNTSMVTGTLTTGATTNDTTTQPNWQPGAQWSGVFSGAWAAGLNFQGSNGYSWSSTADSAGYARSLVFSSGGVSPGNNDGTKYSGRSVRCVLP